MLSTFLTSGNLINFLGHKGVSTYLDASIKFDKKGTTIEEFIQNVTRMQQKLRSSGLKLTSSGGKIFDKLTNTINLKLGFNTVQKILQSENFGLILSAVIDFFSVEKPEIKTSFETIQNVLQKGRRPKNENTDEKILSMIEFLLQLCIPEIDWFSRPFKIRDDTDENPVNFFEFQFLETNSKNFWWKIEDSCECDTCGGETRQRFFLNNMGDKKIRNLEITFTDEIYDNYICVLQKRCNFFQNLVFKPEETKGSVSKPKTLEGLYKIETNLYSHKSTNHEQAEIEHYKKEYFFRQYRKYCM